MKTWLSTTQSVPSYSGLVTCPRNMSRVMKTMTLWVVSCKLLVSGWGWSRALLHTALVASAADSHAIMLRRSPLPLEHAQTQPRRAIAGSLPVAGPADQGLHHRYRIAPSLRTSTMLKIFFSEPSRTFLARKSAASTVPSAYIVRPHTLCVNEKNTVSSGLVRL